MGNKKVMLVHGKWTVNGKTIDQMDEEEKKIINKFFFIHKINYERERMFNQKIKNEK